ncbi:AAA-like domain protein [compost metagenome]
MSKLNVVEERIVLKLENDIESTPDDKSSDVDSFWSSINGLQEEKNKPTFSFEILSDRSGASFYLSIPNKYKGIISKKLNAAYPDIEVVEAKKDPVVNFVNMKSNEYVSSCELKLMEHESFNLKTSGLQKSFLNNLLNTINHYNEEETSLIQIIMKPNPERSNVSAEKRRVAIKNGKITSNSYPVKVLLFVSSILIESISFILDILFTKGQLKKAFKETSVVSPSSNKKEKESKYKKPCFTVSIRIATKSNDSVIAEETVKSIATVFKELDDENKLRPIKINIKSMTERDMKKGYTLATNEIAQFAYLPGKNVSASNIDKGGVKMPYDKNIPNKGVVFGFSPQQNNRLVAFPMNTISKEKYDSLYADYEKLIDNICKPRLVLGMMGTGKSEWIVNYTLSLIEKGLSVILVDPKNDTQKRLIESIPEDKLDKINYLDLGDLLYPPGMNLLRRRNPGDPTEISLIVQSLISFFKKQFGKSWGFAMQQLIMMTGNIILLDEIATLYEFQLMLTNKEYRGKMIDKVEERLKDKNVGGKAMLKELLAFWKQFHSWSEKDQLARINSTMNKIGIFMSNRIVRAIVSQDESFDFRKAGDNGRITIVNIPDGELQDENRELLASFINKAIWLDYRSRSNIPIEKRYPTVWLIEEAHMVMDDEFIPVLTQSRGYRLGVTVLTQGLNNFESRGYGELKDILLTNCKNKIVFRVGPSDARILSDEFAPLTAFDLMNCPDYHFYSKILLEGGKVSDVFFAHSPDMAPVLRNYDKYKEKHRSGRKTIDEIEDQLDERHGLIDPTTISILNFGDIEPPKVEEKPKRKSNSKKALEFLE